MSKDVIPVPPDRPADRSTSNPTSQYDGPRATYVCLSCESRKVISACPHRDREDRVIRTGCGVCGGIRRHQWRLDVRFIAGLASRV